ncbi:MAG: tetratricopeptide repeat protein [Spirochaetaceae bacterium]|nr:tetratricopeptide repeat protein [Spirochaetaceae bacterium]
MAIEDFTEAVNLNPKLSPDYFLRGNAYIASVSSVVKIGEQFITFSTTEKTLTPAPQQAYDKAITDYNRAVRLDPDFALAYNGRGNAYDGKGDYDRAIADCNQAVL